MDAFLDLYLSDPAGNEEKAISLYENLCFLFERTYREYIKVNPSQVPDELKNLLIPITRMTEVVPLLSLNPFHTARRLNEPPLSIGFDGVEFK